jgi:hypothetical protein
LLVHNQKLTNLILTTKNPKFNQIGICNPLPAFDTMTYITQLSIRTLHISYSIPIFPPNLIILDLFYTTIHHLDNLPPTLKQLKLSHNGNLTNVVLPHSLQSFEASYQVNIHTLTLTPSIVYLRLYQCRFTRINRFSLNSIRSCIIPRPCVVGCIIPYKQLHIDFIIPQHNPNPLSIFSCINNVNRLLDEDLTSIFYRLRQTGFYSNTPDSPITKALTLASNPPRRFTEFIIDYLV